MKCLCVVLIAAGWISCSFGKEVERSWMGRGRGRRTGPGGKRRRRRDFDKDNWGMRERGCGFAIVRKNTCCPAFPSTIMYPPNPMCC